MRQSKLMGWLLKGLAVLGGIIAAAMLIRSSKAAKESGQKLTDVLKDDVRNTTRFSLAASVRVPTWFVYLWVALLSAGVFVGIVYDDWVPLLLAFFFPLGRLMYTDGTLGQLWLSFPGAATTTLPATFLPQFIGFDIATVPTSFQIQVQGDGITFNLNGTGLDAMNGIRQVGFTATEYLYQLANGLVNGKNISVTVANADAAALNIYGWSMNPGNMYNTYQTQNALLNSGIVLDKFAYAAFPSAGASDTFTIDYMNGTSQISLRNELNFMLRYTQDNTANQYNIDNIAPATVRRVTFIPQASQNIFVMQYQSVSGTVNAAVINKG